jgi:NADH dehydrogenase FAD-containing subunit
VTLKLGDVLFTPGRLELRHCAQPIRAALSVLTAGIVASAVAGAIPVVRDQRGRIAVDATMRSRGHPQVWALGDCASILGPDGVLTPRWPSMQSARRDTSRRT